LGIFWASLKVETRFTFKEAQKNLLISQEVFFVDNSIEISNISFSPRNFELAIQSIQFIQSILYSIIFSTTS
jgi:hypothetical protein